MCSHSVFCLDPERNTFVCLDCSYPTAPLQAQDQMQKCIRKPPPPPRPLMLMTVQSVLSSGVGHKLNAMIRGVEEFCYMLRMIMENVGMEECVAIIILSSPFTLCSHLPWPTSLKQTKNLLMNDNKTGHLLSSVICTVLVILAYTSVQYSTPGLTQMPSRHVFLACVLRALTSDSFKHSTLEAIWHIPDAGSVDLTWESADATSWDGLHPRVAQLTLWQILQFLAPLLLPRRNLARQRSRVQIRSPCLCVMFWLFEIFQAANPPHDE